jgi:hypothetical protein
MMSNNDPQLQPIDGSEVALRLCAHSKTLCTRHFNWNASIRPQLHTSRAPCLRVCLPMPSLSLGHGRSGRQRWSRDCPCLLPASNGFQHRAERQPRDCQRCIRMVLNVLSSSPGRCPGNDSSHAGAGSAECECKCECDRDAGRAFSCAASHAGLASGHGALSGGHANGVRFFNPGGALGRATALAR